MNKKLLIMMLFLLIALMIPSIPETHSNFTTTANSSLSLDFLIEPTYTYYFQLPPGWGSSTVYAYMWGNIDEDGTIVTVENAGYPGILMECVDSIRQIYSYTLSTELAYKTYGENVFNNIIFTDSSSKKTIDLSVSKDINGKIFAPEMYQGNGTRMICYRFDPCYVYIWNSNGAFADWPGTLIGNEYRISDKSYYTIVDDSIYPNIIFNGTFTIDNGDGTQTKYTNWQTADLTIPEYQDLTCVINSNYSSTWKRLFYFGSWYAYSSWTETEYNNWQSTDYQSFLVSSQAGY